MKDIFKKTKEGIEKIIPMTLGSFFIFLFTLYLFFIVGKSIYSNYESNKELEKEGEKIEALKQDISLLKNEINYYQTKSFKEKEARAKLGYKAPGENVIALPLDKEEEKVADKELGEVIIKTPNYVLWWEYLSGE